MSINTSVIYWPHEYRSGGLYLGSRRHRRRCSRTYIICTRPRFFLLLLTVWVRFGTTRDVSPLLQAEKNNIYNKTPKKKTQTRRESATKRDREKETSYYRPTTSRRAGCSASSQPARTYLLLHITHYIPVSTFLSLLI